MDREQTLNDIAVLKERMRELVEKAESEKRELTADETAEYGKMKADIEEKRAALAEPDDTAETTESRNSDSKNKKSIDYVVLTHPDVDHSGNMAYIISNYKIGKFFRPRIYEKYENAEPFCENETYRQIIQALLKYNVDTEFLGEKEWNEGNTRINFLSTLVATVSLPILFNWSADFI